MAAMPRYGSRALIKVNQQQKRLHMTKSKRPLPTLRDYRLIAGPNKSPLTYEQAGDRVGVVGVCIYRWETCRRVPNMKNILLLGQAYGITADEVIRTFMYLRDGVIHWAK